MSKRLDAPSMLRAGRSQLVGRNKQVALLTEHLSEAQSGYSVVVMLAGAPGIGKTRLLEEFPPSQLAMGLTVLRGGASQAEGMPPYLPFLEALGAYITALPTDMLHHQIGTQAASLATLFPEIPARLGLFPRLSPGP
jgi:predicted ATPase